MFRLSVYKKLNVALILMFFVITTLFWWIHQLNIQDIRTELSKNELGEVKFVSTQMTSQFEQVLTNTNTLSTDPSVRDYIYALEFGDDYLKYSTKLNLLDKLTLYSASTVWSNKIILYYLDYDQTVTNEKGISNVKYQPGPFNEWAIFIDSYGNKYYSNYFLGRSSSIVIETRIYLDNLDRILTEYPSDNLFMYDSANNEIISSNSSNDLNISNIFSKIKSDEGFFYEEIEGEQYLFVFAKSDTMDLYIIDYHPSSTLIKPIKSYNIVFILSIIILIILSISFSIMLRNQIKRPIIKLRKAINRFDRGDYTSRVEQISSEEFKILGDSFNKMAENTQNLIVQILQGELLIKEARLKQFQSQINPHFLYNCLNYINSKASVADHLSVVDMTLHLSAYYRYTHQVEELHSTFDEELEFTENYLAIIHMRKKKIQFEIKVPNYLRPMKMPRIILQPLVENCVLHGLENRIESGLISIDATEDEESIYIRIEDNGVGIDYERLLQIKTHLKRYSVSKDQVGIGIRNVNERLKLYYGSNSSLSLESIKGEGTTYIITIKKDDFND